MQEHNIIFEVIPHAKTASESYTNKIVDRIVNAVNEMKGVGALNIPEIVEENHIGVPYYKNVDNRKFGLLLRDKCKRDLIIDTVVVHKPKEKFEEWLDESISYGIKNFVFVGAKINSIKYPGPNIIEANSIAKNRKINIGNILIPERENEADKLISKTASGCNFFTSQVLFESKNIIKILEDYSIRCEQSGLKPAKIFLSFAPVYSLEDMIFIKWLGAEVKEKTEKKFKSAQNIGEESIKIITEVLNEIFNYGEEREINIPLGLDIEYITLHNLELAKNLVNILSDFKTENYLKKLAIKASW